jgi:ABC-type antimicrobial peptide transport system permease subunit
MADVVSEAVARERFIAFAFSVLAVLALALGATGIYGVTAYVVGNRRREIGLRMALGDRRERVVGRIVLRMVLLTSSGVLLGVGGLAVTSSIVQRVLFQVSPLDLPTLAGVASVLVAVSTVATLLPADRIAAAAPAAALCAE